MNNEQMVRFSECSTISVLRETEFYGMNMLWFVCTDCTDWLGFMDDLGNFIPVSWC